MDLGALKMRKLILIIGLIFVGSLLIKFMRGFFSLGSDPIKYHHFFPFGFNFLEVGIVIFLIIAGFGILMRKDS